MTMISLVDFPLFGVEGSGAFQQKFSWVCDLTGSSLLFLFGGYSVFILVVSCERSVSMWYGQVISL